MPLTFKTSALLGLLTVSLIVAPLGGSNALSAERADSSAEHRAWKQHHEKLKRHPHILRYYTFETTSAKNAVAPSLAGQAEPLRYTAQEPLEVVEGRWPGNSAVRLDRGSLQAKPFDVNDSSFTVEIWFRKHGQGSHLGNGRTSGMLFAQGDGYWNGLRVWTSYPAKDLRFELGRPKPGHAFGLTADDPVPDGVWHHLAVTWDGREMRLYLNGVLLRAAPYSGDYAAPSGPLRIGFAGAGIGSVKMDVDEVAVYDRSLSPEEILHHAYFQARLSQQTKTHFLAGTDAIARADWAAAGTEFGKILEFPDLAPEYRAVARIALGQSLRRRNKTTEAAAQFAAVCEAADAPEQLREIAVRLCIPAGGSPVHATASKRVYERLLETAELSPRERIATGLCLAECCLDDDDPTAARRQYEAVLEMPDLAPREAWNLRLEIAHTYLKAKDYKAARDAYARLASRSDVPPEFRGNCLLCIAHTFTREKAYEAAAAAFAGVVDCEEAPPHFRQEARERIREMTRLAEGLPARDPAASRAKLPPPPEPALTFYVSPDGAEGNPGTEERSFAGLKEARDAIRALKASRGLPTGGVAVLVRGGTYPVRRTLELTEADSGTADSPVVYRALPGETPRFTGGVKLDRFTPVTDRQTLSRLPPEARGRVVQLDLNAAGVADHGTLGPRGYGMAGYPTHPWVDLYIGGKPMQLARWPNEGFVHVGKVHQGQSPSDQTGAAAQFEYEGDRPQRWTGTDDVWMFGYWVHLWAGRCVKLSAIDPSARRITTAHRTSYGYREGQPYYYFNLLEELDQPGEWYLDRRTGLLYLYPPGELRSAVVQFPILSAPLVRMENASHVTFRGLVFELGRAEGAVITGGARNLLAGCTFRQLGTNAVIISGGSGHGVLGCDLNTLGAGGVRAAGGDRATLTPGNHFVENCHISNFARIDRVYAPAVHLDGVGNRIAHNLMHDSPHHGMRVEGYEHAVEFNEIHSVVYEADDQAGIDMYGNPAYRGNVIRHNYWHHIGSGHDVAGQSGIRLDDFISAVLVYGNVFHRSAGGRFGGVQIHGGKDNIVDNNLFIDCKSAISFSPWGEKRWLERLGRDTTRAAVARGGVDLTRPPHGVRYPDLAQMSQNADRNFIWRNLAIDCGRFSIRDRGVNEMMDNHVLSADPNPAGSPTQRVTLPEDSPIYDRFGFRPIPFDEIGLYQDEYRATWPVQHDITPHYFQEY